MREKGGIRTDIGPVVEPIAARPISDAFLALLQLFQQPEVARDCKSEEKRVRRQCCSSRKMEENGARWLIRGGRRQKKRSVRLRLARARLLQRGAQARAPESTSSQPL